MSRDIDIRMECCNIWNILKDKSQMINYLVECKKRIAELEQQLAELKKNAIVPKFKYKHYVYVLYTDIDIFKGQVDMFDYYTNRYLIFFGEDIGSDWFSENLLFATEQEAQEKLKEMKGNE